MSSFKDWINAFRLRTLPLSVSGIILASCFAAYNGVFNWLTFVFAMLTTINFQILSNLANDYGDGVRGTDNENRVGPERAVQSGKISPEQMLLAIRILILTAIGFAFLVVLFSFGLNKILLSLLFFFLGALCILAAINYTVGSKPYGYRGLGDIFVFIFFGLVSVVGCYVLYARAIHHVVFLPAITLGLLSTAVLNLNNMRDIESDKIASKKTFAVILGLKKAKIYHFVLIISSLIVSMFFGLLYYTSPFNLIYILVYIPLVMHLIRVSKINNLKDFDPELKVVALSAFAFSILLGLGQLL
jgi:1,4-dihydroxy-2-naphthoate octaprenyltransferase